MTDVGDSVALRCLKDLSLVATKEKSESPVLDLVIRQRSWTGNFRTPLMIISLHFTVYVTYSTLWQCH